MLTSPHTTQTHNPGAPTVTDTLAPPAICSLFTLKLALEKLRSHALRVRDTAQNSAIQLAGKRLTKELQRHAEVHPDEGINAHLLSLVDDIEAVLGDCDEFAQSIEVLTGKWHQDESEPEPQSSKEEFADDYRQREADEHSPARQEPTPSDEPNIALQTGIADLVSTIAGAKAQPSGA